MADARVFSNAISPAATTGMATCCTPSGICASTVNVMLSREFSCTGRPTRLQVSSSPTGVVGMALLLGRVSWPVPGPELAPSTSTLDGPPLPASIILEMPAPATWHAAGRPVVLGCCKPVPDSGAYTPNRVAPTLASGAGKMGPPGPV